MPGVAPFLYQCLYMRQLQSQGVETDDYDIEQKVLTPITQIYFKKTILEPWSSLQHLIYVE